VAKIHGKGGAIYVGGAKGSGGTKWTYKSEWSLQRNRDYVDATAFGEANKTYLAGLPNVQGNFSGFLDTAGDLLLDAATSGALDVYLYADDATLPDGTEVLVAHGPAFVDATVTCSNTDAVRITGEFRASDSWTIDL
jgi:hypothetical protein